MLQNKHNISRFVVFIILALVASSSFCMNWLVNSVSAAGDSKSIGSSKFVESSESAKSFQSIKSSKSIGSSQAIFAHHAPVNRRAIMSPVDQHQSIASPANVAHNNSNNSDNVLNFSPITHHGLKDCCFDQNHSATAVSIVDGSSHHFAFVQLAISGENTKDVFFFNRPVIHAPPPHLAALRSIKKNE